MSIDYIVEGGSLVSVGTALHLSTKRKDRGEVLLAVRETYLGGEIYASARHTLPLYMAEEAEKAAALGPPGPGEWLSELFNKSLDARKSGFAVFHPDRFVKALEDLCGENRIRFLYGVTITEVTGSLESPECGDSSRKRIVTLAGKAGVKKIACLEVLFPQGDFYPEIKGNQSPEEYGPSNVRGGLFPNTYCIHLLGVPAGRTLKVWTDDGGEAELMPGSYGPDHGILSVKLPDRITAERNEAARLCLAKREALKAYAALKKLPGFEPVYPGRFALRPACGAVNPFLAFLAGASGKAYPEDEVEIQPEKSSIECGVFVAGGGTAGAMAAFHSARNGADTVLADLYAELGGTGTIGGVSTYWFGRRYADVREVDERIKQLYKEYEIAVKPGIWSEQDDFHPGIKSLVLTELCLEAGVRIIPDVCVCGIMTGESTDGDKRVTGAYAAAGRRKVIGIHAKTVIDATGDGDLAAAAGAGFCYGSERDVFTYWASLAQYPSPDRYKNNFSSGVLVSDMEDYTRFIRTGRKRKVAGSNAYPNGQEAFDHGVYVSMRESRHMKGVRQIDLKDTITRREYLDALYTVFSNYDPKGKLSADMVYAGVLPQQTAVLVPLSALLPVTPDGKRIRGLIVAGKAISCTHNAFPALRMQPDLMHQGSVVGMLASYAVRNGMEIDAIPDRFRRSMITKATGDTLSLPCGGGERSLADAVREFDRYTRTHWIDIGFTEEVREVPDAIRIMTADRKEVLPLLVKRYRNETEREERAILAGFLLWHGSGEGIGDLIGAIEDELNGTEGLPVRRGSCMCAQLLPDHGVMPEIVYRLNLLAWYRGGAETAGETGGGNWNTEILRLFETIFMRLKQGPRDYRAIEKGIFHYIESFAYVAERSGIRGFLPMLAELAQFPEFLAAAADPEDISIERERYLILYVILRRAQARLGDGRGYLKLAELCSCDIRPIAESARMELKSLAKPLCAAGEVVPADTEGWKEWIRGRELPVQRITEKIW